MALEIPLWSTGPTGNEFQHSATMDRRLLDTLFMSSGGVVALNDLRVVPRALGANMSVDIGAGSCIIPGSSVSYQGKYLCRSTETENRAISTAPSSGSRNDLVVARVRDSEVTGVQDGFFIEVLNNTTITPADAIPLARVTVPAGTASIQASHITDLRASASISPDLLRYDSWPAPVAHGNLANKGYVDHSIHFTTRESVHSSSTSVLLSHAASGTTTIAAGTVTLPAGWNNMDVEFHAYFETVFKGATHWRYTYNFKAFLNGSWTTITPISTHAHSSVRDSNTSGTWVYSGHQMFGRIWGLTYNANLRFEYQLSTLGGLNSSNIELRSSRRYIYARKFRRV
jgi:hypothetical protein